MRRVSRARGETDRLRSSLYPWLGGGRAQDRALIGPFNLPEVACVGLGSDWMLKFARPMTGGGLVGSNDVSSGYPAGYPAGQTEARSTGGEGRKTCCLLKPLIGTRRSNWFGSLRAGMGEITEASLGLDPGDYCSNMC